MLGGIFINFNLILALFDNTENQKATFSPLAIE